MLVGMYRNTVAAVVDAVVLNVHSSAQSAHVH